MIAYTLLQMTETAKIHIKNSFAIDSVIQVRCGKRFHIINDSAVLTNKHNEATCNACRVKVGLKKIYPAL